MGRFAAKAAQGKHADLVVRTFKAYLDNPALAEQKNPLKDRPPSQQLFVLPFSRELPANYFVKASAFNAVVTSYLAKVNAGAAVRARDTLTLGTQFAIRLDGFSAARVSIRTGRASTGTRETSKTSGLRYTSYGGSSRSIPFGKANATETMDEAFTAIKDAILDGVSATNAPLITLVREKPGRL